MKLCLGRPGAELLEALKAVGRTREASPRRESDEEGMNISITSTYCAEPGGQPMILSDARLAQQYFCRFSDGSLVIPATFSKPALKIECA
ncbi:MAG: DUF333 domain-containing protein [Oligoflexia bacterium]|nr:DUF333 domain-containing protein [Oligoflexia bacterium]